jgi:hypothetical protein
MGYKSPTCYSLNIMSSTTAPLDSTTYYFGAFNQGWTTSTPIRRIYIPRAGRITRVVLYMFALTTAGTAEDIVIVIRKNDTTDYTFSTVGLANASRFFSNYALDIPVIAGDYIELKVTTPAWVTNPDGVYTYGSLFIETE